MLPWFRSSPGMNARFSTTALLFISAAARLSGQDFVARSGALNPFGPNGGLPFGQVWDFGGGAGIKGGFSSGIGFNSNYDSNFFQDSSNGEDEVTLSLTPRISYTTDPEGGANAMISASYAPTANWYLNNPDLNAFDQGVMFSMVVSGSRTTISGYLSFSQQSGVDRLAGGFLTGSALSVGLQGSYQLAPRTNIYANFTPTIVDYEQGSFTGFSDYSTSVGGFWAASELLSIGPSIGYTTSSSDNTGDFDSWTFSGNVRYQVAARVSLAASLGVQFSSYERDSSTNVNATGSLNATYQINELWQWNNSIQSGTTPSPGQTNYSINNWSIASMLNRSLVAGSVGMGVNMNFSSYEQVGPTKVSEEDEQNYGLILSYSRPLFSDRVGFNSSISYFLNQGRDDWSQVLVNLGMNYSF